MNSKKLCLQNTKVFKDLNQSVEMTSWWWWWLTEAINDFLLEIFFPSMKLYYLGWLTSTTGYSKKAITFYCTGWNKQIPTRREYYILEGLQIILLIWFSMFELDEHFFWWVQTYEIWSTNSKDCWLVLFRASPILFYGHTLSDVACLNDRKSFWIEGFHGILLPKFFRRFSWYFVTKIF